MSSESDKFPSKTAAVALLSAGLDSSVAMAMYLLGSDTEVRLALTCDYGQRAAAQEIARSQTICRHYGVPHRVLDLKWMGGFPSALTQVGVKIPSPAEADLDNLEVTRASAKAVWVPNRNGILLETAAGFAESLGVAHVLVGFNREEAATFPDNSSAYLNALNQAFAFSTQGRVQVVSPTLLMNKEEIVEWATRHGFPMHMIWSCYEKGEKMCGHCESCQRLKRAMDDSEFVDQYFQSPTTAPLNPPAQGSHP